MPMLIRKRSHSFLSHFKEKGGREVRIEVEERETTGVAVDPQLLGKWNDWRETQERHRREIDTEPLPPLTGLLWGQVAMFFLASSLLNWWKLPLLLDIIFRTLAMKMTLLAFAWTAWNCLQGEAARQRLALTALGSLFTKGFTRATTIAACAIEAGSHLLAAMKIMLWWLGWAGFASPDKNYRAYLSATTSHAECTLVLLIAACLHHTRAKASQSCMLTLSKKKV